MKLKDIEKRLKNEQGKMGVPDVLARAKRAPINRLLDGQAPLRAFNKPLATRLLWCAMLLLIAIVLCMAVYLIMPKASPTVEYGYASLVIDRDGEQSRYGLVIKDDTSVVLVVNESAGEHVVSTSAKELNSAIKELYDAKSTDKVELCVFFDSAAASNEVGSALVYALDSCLAGAGSTAKTVVVKAEGERKQQWAMLIGGTASSSDSVAELVDLYLEKYSA